MKLDALKRAQNTTRARPATAQEQSRRGARGEIVRLLLLVAACISSTTACMGGCYVKADAVRTDPKTDCLALFGGQSASDPTVCAVPQLGGMNNCSDALTLPKRSASDDAVVVAPGERIAWPIPSESVPPAVMVNQAGGRATNYVISATLGNQSITITVPVHDD